MHRLHIESISGFTPVPSAVAEVKPSLPKVGGIRGQQFTRVQPSGVPELMRILASSTFERAVRKRQIQRPRVLCALEASALGYSSGAFVVEQMRADFPSYPCEWTPRMLAQAGRLQLKLARELFTENLGLRRALPAGVEFLGPTPILVQLDTLEVRAPGSPYFEPFQEFLQGYILPLLLHREFGLSLRSLFLNSTHGVSLAQAYETAGWGKRCQRPFLNLVTLPYLMSLVLKRQTRPLAQMVSPQQAAYFFHKLLDHLEQALSDVASQGVEPKAAPRLAYPEGQEAIKRKFVLQALQWHRPHRLLDLGSAEGIFSQAAAKNRAHVVAVDNDARALDALHAEAQLRLLDILPLNMELFSPTPATGLAEQRSLSFLERSAGYFDFVLALASPRHVYFPERRAMQTLLSLWRTVSRNYVLFEFVGAKDLCFSQRTSTERPAETISAVEFEMMAREFFQVEAVQHLRGCDRTLYLFKVR